MAETPGKPINAGNQGLEQFLLLAKGTKAGAMTALIMQVVEAPGVYVFGELLEMPNVQELAEGPHKKFHNLLTLFAYGTYQDYKADPSNFPELSKQAISKLRHLTIVSIAAKCKRIPYTLLQQELDVNNLRELEDLFIETIYAGVIEGKLDQKNQQLEVDYAIGRDMRQEAIVDIVNTLQQWCDGCETVLSNIEEQIIRANKNKDNCIKKRQQIETEVINIKKAIKASSQDIDEQHMSTDTREADIQPSKPAKKQSKMKGLRGSGKFWNK
ncbi:COP9 signalosome complex subunit 7b-like [Antedon mediterranea]|uniref:COP9 signalosome complex subunit 7b-like n=1 Tax=Antedon mediterranea TaxID=105859 RepID=UPI003AF5BB62